MVAASLLADGTEVTRATGLLLRRSDIELPQNEGIARMPEGPDGIESSTMSGARPFDTRGLVGRSVHALLANQRR